MGSVEIKMDFGGGKSKGKSKEVKMDQLEQIKTSMESNAPLTEEQKEAFVLEWASEKVTLKALVQQEINSQKKKRYEVRKQEKQEHANEIA